MIDLFGRKRRQQRREMWQRIATEHGGAFHLPKGIWRPTTERVEATVRGIPIVLDVYMVSSGNAHTWYTRVVAPLAYGPARKLQIAKHGVLAGIGNVFREDVEVGHAEFDRAFVVRCSQPAFARRLVSVRASELLLASFVGGRLRCNGVALELIVDGEWQEERRVRDGIELIAELASRDLYGAERLRAIPGGVVGTRDDGVPVAEVGVAVRVVIGAEDHDGQLVMTARTTEPCALDPCELAIEDGVARGERVALLPPGAQVAVRQVGTGVLSITSAATWFRWGGVEIAPGELAAGAALLGALAAGGVGSTYR